eukprot:NODE_757_length_1659_cov_73.541775_g747_i0.p1 GENE.NODE_757_length_1659_cov_73.541775_g747_i0~~NODE_757_length_1659_cov_73.541775_g747_i0.p1  ORF type:complete len:501 (+),score=110.34 NODE_757_length_1659_cov_73.541775_g747_i0:103-1503(+)
MGVDADGQPTVGFLVGQYKEGTVAVGTPYEVRAISDIAHHYAFVVRQFMQKHYDTYKCYSKTDHTGFWRRLVVRETDARDAMLLLQINEVPAEQQAAVDQLMKDFTEHVTTAKESQYLKSPHQLKSVQLQVFGGRSNAAPSDLGHTVMHGDANLEETLCGRKFRISPNSFFQVNNGGNERLVELVKSMLELDKDTILLDLCCGTGTLGLCLASHVASVWGVDIVEDAIKDARSNAERNGVANTTYVADRAESPAVRQALRDHIKGKPGARIVAILDPPRGGMHNSFLRWIRNCDIIKRFVYVSCDQSSLVSNTGPLCKPVTNEYTGLPFYPVEAACLDLFPHTEHVEMLVTFARNETPLVDKRDMAYRNKKKPQAATDTKGDEMQQDEAAPPASEPAASTEANMQEDEPTPASTSEPAAVAARSTTQEEPTPAVASEQAAATTESKMQEDEPKPSSEPAGEAAEAT